MAAVQVATTALALIGVLAVSFAILSNVVDRMRDRALMNVATATVTALSELPDDVSEKRIARELDQHRPAGVRVEAIDEQGDSVAVAGEGPRLRSAGDDACANQEGWRVCERSVGGLRVLVGRSRRDDDAISRSFFTILALVSGAALVLGGIASRALAGRGLAPFAAISRRLADVRPGSGDRIDGRAGLAEVDDLAARFDELLARVDEAVARERRFAAQASHELRTPLTTLQGELEVLAADAVPSQEGVRRALASAKNLVRLVESLLLFGKAEARFDLTQLEVLNLADLIRREAEACAIGPAASRLSLNVPDEVMVLGDDRLLGRAVSNLLDNALKYSPPDAPVVATLTEAGAEAVLRVSDRGTGVPEALRERVFEPFYRESRARVGRPGHGLGLPLARAVARAHGGEVLLAKGAEVGTTFEIRLPVAKP
jgi:signal transduction histidine kinase